MHGAEGGPDAEGLEIGMVFGDLGGPNDLALVTGQPRLYFRIVGVSPLECGETPVGISSPAGTGPAALGYANAPAPANTSAPGPVLAEAQHLRREQAGERRPLFIQRQIRASGPKGPSSGSAAVACRFPVP